MHMFIRYTDILAYNIKYTDSCCVLSHSHKRVGLELGTAQETH